MKRLTYLLVAALVLGIPSAHAAKITPGSSCKSAGQKATYKGKSYTCIKLGKKLYWDNGVPSKKANTSLLDTPASCNVAVPFWRIEEPKLWFDDKDVWVSAMLVNASIKYMATDVNVYIDYSDDYGVLKREKIVIPKLFPGQTLEFGTGAIFDDGKFPTDVSFRSTCKSKKWKQYKVITGKSSVSLEKDYDDFTTSINGVNREVVETWVTLRSKIIIDNVFNQDLECSDTKCNFGFYGTFKDSFGNTYGGVASDGFSESWANDIEPGGTGLIDLQVTTVFLDLPLYPWLSRVTQFQYTLIPKF
jgi:hypothetical protein